MLGSSSVLGQLVAVSFPEGRQGEDDPPAPGQAGACHCSLSLSFSGSPLSVEASHALWTQADGFTLPEQKHQNPCFGLQCFVFPFHLCCTLLEHFYEKKTVHGFSSHWREKKEETSRYIFISRIFWHSRCQGCPSSMVTAEMRAASLRKPTLCPHHEQHCAIFSTVTDLSGVRSLWHKSDSGQKQTQKPPTFQANASES